VSDIARTACPTSAKSAAFSSPAAPRSGTRVRGAVSTESFARPAVPPRHSPNARPPRRTRRSVRPASGRVSDRTVVRVRATLALAFVQVGSGAQGRRTMRKTTAPTTRRHRSVSPIQHSGLIARENDVPQSAAAECALDNLSHRTISLIERLWASAAGARAPQANRLNNDLLMEPSWRSLLRPAGAPAAASPR
jgi:hypothetical protein